MLGTSIVRYRLFTSSGVKKGAVYLLVWGVVTSVLVAPSRTPTGPDESAVTFLPLGFWMTMLVSPVGQAGGVDRAGHVQPATRLLRDVLTSASGWRHLDFGRLMETLVRARAWRAAHPLRADDLRRQRSAFVVYAKHQRGPSGARGADPSESRIVQWLNQTAGSCEGRSQAEPRDRRVLRGAESELDAIKATLIVPLKIEASSPASSRRREALGTSSTNQDSKCGVLANQVRSRWRTRDSREISETNAELMQRAAQVPVPGQHVARAADAAQLDHRFSRCC